ncbi:protein Dok-7 isoform X2 [Anguilla rostrata]|uniref:protein Dok-7 isoform X2 n=1 Tax=Anguilla rostrata TaxID=7938 RepID=UPI0030D2881C
MTDVVVVEGQVKLRDGKKWKSRWVTLRKPSPVADCLVLQAHKDKSDKANGRRERWSVTLEDICGLEPGLSLEGVSYTLSVVCLSQAVVLGFDSKEALLAWDIRICYCLGEVHRFNVGVLPGTKLDSGPATLHLCNNLLAITRDVPPAVIGQWNLPDLRRYGAVPNGFVFEGGTRCGYWTGVFFLSCAEGKQISFLFDCIVRGISPTRAPLALRPVLPDPSASPAYLEERLDREAQELEKRLSLLSPDSQQSTTASSMGGDDRSISSSSDTSDSQSDTSIGSRLAVWAEPVMSPAPVEPPVAPADTDRAPSAERTCAVVGGVARPPPRPPCSRRLHEIGRQSSSDSGIATGSHSSYSGSFSSYAGSLDIGRGDEFGSLPALPPNLLPELDLCTCPRDPNSEYQVPCSLRTLYDRPRSLFPNRIPPQDQPTPSPLSSEPAGGSREPGEAGADPIPGVPSPEKQGQAPGPESGGTPPSAEEATPPWEFPHPAALRSLFAPCPLCGGMKGTALSHSGPVPTSVVADKKGKRREDRRKVDVAYEVMEGQGAEKTVQCEDKSSYEPMARRGRQKSLHETDGAVCAAGPSARVRPHREHAAAGDPKESYELMASSFDAPKRCDLIREDFGAGNSKYAQIDIAAMETAHRVGTQHALGREERLLELQKKRGALQ